MPSANQTSLPSQKRRAAMYLLPVCLCLFLSAQLQAASLYISDELYVPVRKGQGNQFAILHKGLPSGTRVTLVEKGENWTQIRTAGGITGWVRNQFLSSSPPAKLRLDRANKKIASLSEELKALRKEKTSLVDNQQKTEQELNEADQLARKTAEELASLKVISSSAVESHQRLQSMTKRMQLLQTENDVLKSENESLRQSERTTFFLYGAFAVILGVIITILLPKLKPKRNNSGWVN